MAGLGTGAVARAGAAGLRGSPRSPVQGRPDATGDPDRGEARGDGRLAGGRASRTDPALRATGTARRRAQAMPGVRGSVAARAGDRTGARDQAALSRDPSAADG